MKKIALFFVLNLGLLFSQSNNLEKLKFLEGHWEGDGAGFGNSKSVIKSDFNFVMGGKYIEVKNNSKFEPTNKNPEGENHIDWGMISYDKARDIIVFRQFNVEGYVNQYILNKEKSTESELIFETEIIENFMPGGKARWVIKKISKNTIETKFYVSFPGKEFSCFGTNNLTKQK